MPNYKDRTTFVNRLLFLHGLMVASEPLLEMAIAHLPDGKIRRYIEHHLTEEKGHADWLANDLASASVAIPTVHWRAARLAGSQMYLIKFVAPEALLGYMAALESHPLPIADIARLEQWHGHALIRTLRYHAEHDVQHGADLHAIIQDISQPVKGLIMDNMAQTTWLLQEE